MSTATAPSPFSVVNVSLGAAPAAPGTIGIANGSPFANMTRCSSCGKRLVREPWRSMGMGRVCYMRRYQVAAIGSVTGKLLKEGLDPVAQLENIGFGKANIDKADMPGFLLAMNELSLVYRNIEASSRLTDNFKGQMVEIDRNAKSSFQALDLAAQTYVKSVLSDDPADASKQTMSKAAVICSGAKHLKHVAETLTALGDKDVNHHEATDLRLAVQATLITSRLYGHVVKTERQLLQQDQGQQVFEALLGGENKVSNEPAVDPSPYVRPSVNFAGTDDQIINAMAEDSAPAKKILKDVLKHCGNIEDAVVVYSLLDDMNIRGAQVPIAFDASTTGSKNAKKEMGNFIEAVWDCEKMAAAVNEAAVTKDIPHKAVAMGAQLGDRKLFPGYSGKDLPDTEGQWSTKLPRPRLPAKRLPSVCVYGGYSETIYPMPAVSQ